MNKEIKHLTVEQIINIRNKIVLEFDNPQGILNLSNLEYTVSRSEQYQTKADGLFWKATIVLESIVNTHPFIDGNKRTGFECCKTFLEMNGFEIRIDDDEIIRFLIDIATDKMSRRKIML